MKRSQLLIHKKREALHRDSLCRETRRIRVFSPCKPTLEFLLLVYETHLKPKLFVLNFCRCYKPSRYAYLTGQALAAQSFYNSYDSQIAKKANQNFKTLIWELGIATAKSSTIRQSINFKIYNF